MFSPLTKTPLSAVKLQKTNKSSPFFSPSIRRSLTPSVSRNSSLGRSVLNPIIDDTSNHLVEPYGSALPVLVTEAITVAERISDVSVKLEPFGYASLVCGRQLLIWKYEQDGEKNFAHCKELTLPPSDLAHKAELVHLFQTEDSKLPSALAVSPEGHVRYWPNINHEGSSVDALPDLQGQECCSLISIQPLGCILATTSSSLVIITPTIGEGQPNVICRTLNLPLGVLAGISRRVSSFIFGSIPSQTTETKQLNRVLSVRTAEDEYYLYVLSNSSLQKWHIARKDKRENLDELLFEVDLDKELKQNYSDALCSQDTTLTSGLKTWCLDMQLCQSGVIVLTAGTMGRPDSNINYAFVCLNTSRNEPPHSFSSFYLITYAEPYHEEAEENITNYRLLLPSFDSPSAYIYNSKKVLGVLIGSTDAEYSELDFSSSENCILGAGSCEGVALFFTNNCGIVSFIPNPKAGGDVRLLTSMRDISIRQTDPNEEPESLSAKLRSAMCSYCTNDMEKCRKLIEGIMENVQTRENGDFDDAVISLSVGIIDDYPVSDPRWCESIPTGGVSSSLLISYQLEDKLKAHECLISFLRAFNLFEKLTFSKVSDVKVSTNVLLCEHAEKLVAAKALRLFLTDHSEIIENAVQDTLDRRGIEVKNHLTPQDVFFREVSSFQTIFSSLIAWEEEQLNADENVEKTLNAIMTMNKIFGGLLDAICEYRRNWNESYGLQGLNSEYLPWTSRDGNSGVRQHIKEQLEINVNRGLGMTENIQVQGVLYQLYIEILDFYLNSYCSQLENLKGDRKRSVTKEYHQQRSSFIQPLLSAGQYERAAAMAEKYLDFDLLIQICEETKNADRLQRYMLQFTEHNFSEFVFKWYLDKGQKGRLFDKHLGQRDVLGKFLQEHNGLKWIYFIQEEKYDAAHTALKQLALNETQFLNRKKTLLSLTKLCAMISDASPSTKRIQIDAINLEHDLITHQEALPISVVESCGIDPQNMRVFTPEELIEMYITEENSTASAFDFKIALDLLNFMKKPLNSPEVFNLKMRIWAKAILRDNWEVLDISSPIDAIKETTFFQIIELAFDKGMEISDFMPAIEDLLPTPELRELTDNPTFQFLLQAGYEHILKMIA